MKKKLLAKVAKLAMLTFAAVIVVTDSETMTVHAGINWDDYGVNPDDDRDNDNGGGIGQYESEEDFIKAQEEKRKALEAEKEALKALLSNKYSDVNTLNATVKIKANILKAKKKAGNYTKQTPKPSKVVVNGKALKYNKKTKEYALSYSLWDEDSKQWNDVDSLTTPGLYRLEIMGKGSYKGVYTKRIYVYDTAEGSKSMSSVKVKVNKVPYSGEAITSDVITSVKLGKKTLVENTDYTVTYLNNVNSGTGIVRLTAKEGSGLVGEKEVNFTITGGTKISKAKVTGITAQIYDYGDAVTQDMSQIKLTVNGKELEQDKDYAVQYYMNNTKVGTAKIIIAGKGSYYGTITKSFKITKIPITKEMLDEASKNKIKGYTGKAVKTGVGLFDSNAKYRANGTFINYKTPKQLEEKTDYTLSFKNNVKPSDKAEIIVKGKGIYTGTISVYFTIQDKSKSADTQKAAGKDSVTKPETDEELTDTPEEPATDEEVTDTADEPTDTEESDNDADTDENPAEDETPADEGTGNTGSEDADDSTADETDNTGSDNAGDKTSDETGNTGTDDAGNNVTDETDSTGSEDADNTTSGETGNTDSEDADNTVTDETGSTGSDNTGDAVTDNADSTASDNAFTSPEVQSDLEPAIPENSVSEDEDAA